MVRQRRVCDAGTEEVSIIQMDVGKNILDSSYIVYGFTVSD